jgi:hypothetical protein
VVLPPANLGHPAALQPWHVLELAAIDLVPQPELPVIVEPGGVHRGPCRSDEKQVPHAGAHRFNRRQRRAPFQDRRGGVEVFGDDRLEAVLARLLIHLVSFDVCFSFFFLQARNAFTQNMY